MSYKEQIFRELSVIKKSGGKFTFDGINPKTVRHYVFIFNEVHGSDLACSIADGVATVLRKANKKESVSQYVSRELCKLKSIGEQLVLDGEPAVLRMNISRLRKKLGLELSTKVINGKLHVVVMGMK